MLFQVVIATAVVQWRLCYCVVVVVVNWALCMYVNGDKVRVTETKVTLTFFWFSAVLKARGFVIVYPILLAFTIASSYIYFTIREYYI